MPPRFGNAVIHDPNEGGFAFFKGCASHIITGRGIGRLHSVTVDDRSMTGPKQANSDARHVR